VKSQIAAKQAEQDAIQQHSMSSCHKSRMEARIPPSFVLC
jgi:hypothetical protein